MFLVSFPSLIYLLHCIFGLGPKFATEPALFNKIRQSAGTAPALIILLLYFYKIKKMGFCNFFYNNKIISAGQGEGRAHFEYAQVGPKVGQSYTGPTAEK